MGRNGEVRRDNIVGSGERMRVADGCGREWEKWENTNLKKIGLYSEFRGLTATRLRGLVAVGGSLTSGNSNFWVPTATRP